MIYSTLHTQQASKNFETSPGRKKVCKIHLSTVIYFSLFWMICKGQLGKKLRSWYTILSHEIKRKITWVYPLNGTRDWFRSMPAASANANKSVQLLFCQLQLRKDQSYCVWNSRFVCINSQSNSVAVFTFPKENKGKCYKKLLFLCCFFFLENGEECCVKIL